MLNTAITTHTQFNTTRGLSIVNIANWVSHHVVVSGQRRKLAGLGLDALEDMGISEAQAKTEARKPFWV